MTTTQKTDNASWFIRYNMTRVINRSWDAQAETQSFIEAYYRNGGQGDLTIDCDYGVILPN